jgi:hypothetical protein
MYGRIYLTTKGSVRSVKKRTFVAVALAVVFVLALAAPAFAQDMSHSATYNLEGDISLEKQVGHLCNTGAQMKQTIYGQGKMEKVMDVYMEQGLVTVADTNDWVTAPDAVRNLTVTSVIELCAPPKYTYTDQDELTGVVHPWAMYGEAPQPAIWYGIPGLFETGDFFMGSENMMDGDWDPISRQIWAVQVEAAAGFSGNLHQNFEAAYGPYAGAEYDGWDSESEIPVGNDSHKWAWDSDGNVVSGDDYVGNYFNIEQFARTSQGVVRRFIDISSPWSHAYLYVDSTITGMAEVSESYSMDNLDPGASATTAWWMLF